jgi:hypothetical protein
MARFPAGFTVSGYPRLRRRPQSAIPFVFRVLQRVRPWRRYCEYFRFRHVLPCQRICHNMLIALLAEVALFFENGIDLFKPTRNFGIYFRYASRF